MLTESDLNVNIMYCSVSSLSQVILFVVIRIINEIVEREDLQLDQIEVSYVRFGKRSFSRQCSRALMQNANSCLLKSTK